MVGRIMEDGAGDKNTDDDKVAPRNNGNRPVDGGCDDNVRR